MSLCSVTECSSECSSEAKTHSLQVAGVFEPRPHGPSDHPFDWLFSGVQGRELPVRSYPPDTPTDIILRGTQKGPGRGGVSVLASRTFGAAAGSPMRL